MYRQIRTVSCEVVIIYLVVNLLVRWFGLPAHYLGLTMCNLVLILCGPALTSHKSAKIVDDLG